MRSIATLGDIYGPDSGATFYNNNNGSDAGPAGTNLGSAGGPDQAGANPQTINPTSALTGIQGTIIGNPIFQFFLIIVVGIGAYALAKKHVPQVESELGTPRVSVPAFLSIGFQAFVFLVLVKSLLKKVNIPGLSGLAALS